jgi:ribosomal protein S18 acetylase RimI-like enzyme
MRFVRRLETIHRAQIADMLARVPEFTKADVAVALELIDETYMLGSVDSGYRFCVAVGDVDGEVRGYACWGETPIAQGVYDLYWMVVDPAVQRHGIGRALMDAVEQDVGELTGARIIRLETAGKDPAQHFYRACGYRQVGLIEDFYWRGNDLITMTKRLVP